MSYFPILNAPGCKGWTTLCNFPPNDWEVRHVKEKSVNVTWAQDGAWRTVSLGTLVPGHMRTVHYQDVADIVGKDALPFLSLASKPVPPVSADLPQANAERTTVPAWRATLGLKGLHCSTSYQGEIDPFPVPGSLLTFPPFMQFGNDLENYLLFLNLEVSAKTRTEKVEIFNSACPEQLLGSFEVTNNNVTVIPLDGLSFGPNDLPVVICKGMSSIPLYFSQTTDGSLMSLEHTHPPASCVIHGRRWKAQKLLKTLWFSKAGD